MKRQFLAEIPEVVVRLAGKFSSWVFRHLEHSGRADCRAARPEMAAVVAAQWILDTQTGRHLAYRIHHGGRRHLTESCAGINRSGALEKQRSAHEDLANPNHVFVRASQVS